MHAECEAIKEEVEKNHTTQGWAVINKKIDALGDAWTRYIEKEDMYYASGGRRPR